MAGSSSPRATRDAFRSDLQDIEDLLVVSFGPEGRAILTQNPTGQMTITRSGIGILRAVYADNHSPSKKILLNFAEKLHEDCGDGVKSLMFMTAAMFRQCECLEGPSRVLHQLGKLQSDLAQLGAHLESAQSTDVDAVTCGQECSNAKVIKTFFSTRFPVLVSSLLARLLHEWILKISSCICNYKEHADTSLNAQSLVKDFSVLCHYDTGSQSISNSYVQEGFLLNRRSINLLKSGHHRVLIQLFDDELSSNGKFDASDIIYEIKKLVSVIKIYKDGVKDGSCPEFLVLTPTILPEVAVFSLRRENIAIIHGAPIDEVKYLSCVMARFKNELCVDFKYSLVEVRYEHGKDYTFFNIPSVYNIFICGPTNELRAEYAQACHDALKLVIEGNKITLTSRFVEGGGYFERNLHNFVLDKIGLHNDAIPCLGSRMELLRWHEEKLCRRSSALEAVEGNSTLKMISDVFSGLDKDVGKALLEGIMYLPRKLPQPEPGRKKSEAVEHIGLKLSILQHALVSVITLMKIDSVVYTKNKTNMLCRPTSLIR